MKKRSNLSRLLDYTGSYKILAYLSWGGAVRHRCTAGAGTVLVHLVHPEGSN